LLVSVRPQARRDIRGIAFYYKREANVRVTARFLEGIESSFQLLSRSPEAGMLCGFSGRSRTIRKWPVQDFDKLLIFYQVTDSKIDIVRVLHGSRDVETIFS